MKNYDTIKRQDWRKLSSDVSIHLSDSELQRLTSLNDKIQMSDVVEIYEPMISLFDFYLRHHTIKHQKVQHFLGKDIKKVPFIIGISGSVSVGKSTTARLLQTMLQQVYPEKVVELMTTDGFLYSNAQLEEKGLLNKKGFPESYDMEKLTDFLLSVKTGKSNLKAPVYSHAIYDIVPNEYQMINDVDILIVEGINVLQLLPSRDMYASDFFDWSIFVDADPKHIEEWFLQRFELLMDQAKYDPSNFYYNYAIGNRQEAIAMAKHVWETINLKNLNDYILPTKNRADLIIHKNLNHVIDYILLKKY